MITKLVFNLIIIGSSTLLGNHMANRYVQRVRQLHILQICIAKLETEIIYYSTFLPEALKNVGIGIDGVIGEFLCEVSSILQDKHSASIKNAWEKALETKKKNMDINEEDREIIERFGSQLGLADIKVQRQLFELTQAQLYRQGERAEEDRIKYAKLYKSLGFLSGLTIVIILL
ncbi:MAG: stage III sporulation protein AB [Clostridiales bacterium]|nr:stage III sporulation protein AB [Clostridiales bacterium]